ncbi:hypothetical protein, partial [Microvirga massiliensis]|uniref:hypothetical protein n=1 Tax=Microvirga massiliensis TaxID=1033741 RepID=UPI00062B4ED2
MHGSPESHTGVPFRSAVAESGSNSHFDPAHEPPWRQAFVLGDGVIATRTPDRVIRARNGIPEPEPSPPRRPPARPALPESRISPADEQQPRPDLESAVRRQIATLRSTFAPEDHDSLEDSILAQEGATSHAALPQDDCETLPQDDEELAACPEPDVTPDTEEARLEPEAEPIDFMRNETQPISVSPAFTINSSFSALTWLNGLTASQVSFARQARAELPPAAVVAPQTSPDQEVVEGSESVAIAEASVHEDVWTHDEAEETALPQDAHAEQPFSAEAEEIDYGYLSLYAEELTQIAPRSDEATPQQSVGSPVAEVVAPAATEAVEPQAEPQTPSSANVIEFAPRTVARVDPPARVTECEIALNEAFEPE